MFSSTMSPMSSIVGLGGVVLGGVVLGGLGGGGRLGGGPPGCRSDGWVERFVTLHGPMVGGCARNEGRLKMDPPAVLALEARELQLERARLPQPVAALDRARAEGRAAVALVHTALAEFLPEVVEAHRHE